MRIVDYKFPIEIGSVVDMDFLVDGTPVSIQGTSEGQVLIIEDIRIPLPESWTSPDFPIVRGTIDGHILICDTGTDDTHNTWILSLRGQVLHHFAIGSAVVDVVPVFGSIAVAYHPQSAKEFGFPVEPIQRCGVSFFDMSGNHFMGFNQVAGAQGITIENVRCLSRITMTGVVFIPEKAWRDGNLVTNPLVVFDCVNKKASLTSLPLSEAEAVTIRNHYVHLGSPRGHQDKIVSYDLETRTIHHRGDFSGVFRGLDDGGLLAQLSSSHYAVIYPESPEKTGHVVLTPVNE